MAAKISIQQVHEDLLVRPPRAVDGAEKMRRSAVAAIFRSGDNGATELLFMRRARHEKDPWSGQISFPGGRQDPEDVDLTQTAARETLEEVGLDLNRTAQRLGLLDELQARARGNILPMSIQPIAFVLPQGPRPILTHNEEVASTFWIPLHELPDPELRTFVHAERANHPMSFPGVDLGSHGVLWGLTWMMVVEVLHRLGVIPETQPLIVPRNHDT
jgi:8-oxo-dGTP pyrophosphatase MutT (NUDIX family)